MKNRDLLTIGTATLAFVVVIAVLKTLKNKDEQSS